MPKQARAAKRFLMNKSELRKIYLDRQKNITPSARKTQSRQIAARFFDEFELSSTKFLHLFLPIEKFNEIQTFFIIEEIWRRFPRVETLVPRVNFQTLEIENVRFTAASELTENIWNIAEPLNAEIVADKEIDAVLVPLLCFDRQGFRVGYGKGFYDKFLRQTRSDCLKIGLSYFAPIEKISDANELDVKLDCCISADEIYRFEHQRS